MKYIFLFLLTIFAGLHVCLAQWVSINPGAGGQVQDVVADPSIPGTLYLASDMEGVYQSKDNGESWNITGQLMHNRVYAVAVDPKNSNRLYVGTMYGLHLSNDAGITYQFISTTKGKSIGSIAVDPSNSDRIIAAPGWRDDYDFIGNLGETAAGKGELFLSEDRGGTWIKYVFDENSGTDRNVWTINYDLTNPSVVYIGSAKGIYKSTNGGKNWAKIDNPSGASVNRGISLSPDGSVIYAAYDKPGKLYATAVNALSWQTVMTGTGISLSNLNYWYPEVDSRSSGSSHKVLVGMEGQREGLFEGTFNWTGATLSGYSWSKIWSGTSVFDRGWDYAVPNARFAHYTPSKWDRAVWSTTNQTMFEGVPSGNSYSWNNKYSIPNNDFQIPSWGTTWPSYSGRGTESTYSYDIAVHKNYVIQGQGDNGFMESWDYGKSWSNMQHRQNNENLSDVQSVDIADAWGTPMVVAQATTGYGGFAKDGRLYVKPLVNHSPTDVWSLLGAGADKLLGIENGVLRDIAVSPANPAKVFLFSSGYGMYMIEDIGRTYDSWLKGKPINAQKISNGIADGTTSSKKIAPHPTNENVVFYYASSGKMGVYKGIYAENGWTWTKIYNGYGWDSEVHAWEYNGQVYLVYEGFADAEQGDGKNAIVALSLDEGNTWKIIFNKEKAKELRTTDWYSEWSDTYTFQTKGGIAGKGNTVVVNYYNHGFQLGYGIFKGTIQDDKTISWEDWTGDLHFPGPTSSIFAETDKESSFYTTTAGAGAWMRKTGDLTTTQLPAGPQGLQANPIDSKKIALTWTDVAANETGYRIERKTGSGEFATVGQIGRNCISYTDSDLQHSTTYRYRIHAFNQGGKSAYSEETSATTLLGNGVPCQNPNLLTNADFEQNLNGWELYTNAGAAAVSSVVSDPGFSGKNAAKISVSSVSGNENDVQFYTPFLGLEANTSYQLTFKAKASASKTVRVAILLNEAPWTGYLSETILLSPEVKEYGPYTFYAEKDNNDVRIDYFIGKSAGDIWLDTVVVVSTKKCIQYHIDRVSITNCPGNLDIGDTYTLNYSVEPSDAENPNVKWTSSNNNILTVSSNGFLNAVSKGTATVTLQAVDGGEPDQCEISVNMLVEGISIDNCPDTALKPGETFQVKYTILPEGASNKAVVWSSSDLKVATVSKDGLVTAVGMGTASIKVETISEGKRARCSFSVDANSSISGLYSGKIHAYPNPVKRGSDLMLSIPNSFAAELELLNITGKVVYQTTLTEVPDGLFVLKGKELPQSGIYILRIRNNQQVACIKVVVE